MRNHALLLLTLSLLCGTLPLATNAQDVTLKTGSVGDTTKMCVNPAVKEKWIHNIYRQAWNSIQKNPNDCGENPDDGVLNARGEELFKPYSGKVIRYIYLKKLNFEHDFSDTSRSIKNLASRIATTLHSTTRDWVIRNNLYIREGDTLDAYETADNERYLRTIEYIQDARILVMPIEGTDSVDLQVVTKDIFSIKADVNNGGFTMINPRVAETNFLGTGHRLYGGLLWDANRKPNWGYQAGFQMNNIAGSFFNALAEYNTVNAGYSLGVEDEEAARIRIEHPLISPYSHYAGAIEIGTNHSINDYGTPDSLFQAYSYRNFDVWAGYNLCLDKGQHDGKTIRDRKFFSMRYFINHFTQAPQMFSEHYDPVYNDKHAVLGQLTFFRQDYVKTQYIYGFGITEDVPHGYNVSVTGGYFKQLNLDRPYAGVNGDFYFAKGDGSFSQYYFRTGAFYDRGKLDDVALLAGISYFSPVMFTGDFKVRESIRGTYSQLIDPITDEPLRINNVYGLRGFGKDSAQGTQRISLQTETSFFMSRKYYGFRVAPFIYADAAYLRNKNTDLRKGDVYPGVGGGLRTRNENLIFGTIELKCIYFPRPVYGQTAFQVTLNSGLRYRYNTQYVHAPDIARLNADY